MATTPGKRPRSSVSSQLSDNPEESGDQKRPALSSSETGALLRVNAVTPGTVSDGAELENPADPSSKLSASDEAVSTPICSPVVGECGENSLETSALIPVAAAATSSPATDTNKTHATNRQSVEITTDGLSDNQHPIVRFKTDLPSSVRQHAKTRHTTYEPEWLGITVLFSAYDNSTVTVKDVAAIIRRQISSGFLTLHPSCSIDGLELPRNDDPVRAREETRSGHKIVALRGLVVRITQSSADTLEGLRSAFFIDSAHDPFLHAGLKSSVEARSTEPGSWNAIPSPADDDGSTCSNMRFCIQASWDREKKNQHQLYFFCDKQDIIKSITPIVGVDLLSTGIFIYSTATGTKGGWLVVWQSTLLSMLLPALDKKVHVLHSIGIQLPIYFNIPLLKLTGSAGVTDTGTVGTSVLSLAPGGPSASTNANRIIISGVQYASKEDYMDMVAHRLMENCDDAMRSYTHESLIARMTPLYKRGLTIGVTLATNTALETMVFRDKLDNWFVTSNHQVISIRTYMARCNCGKCDPVTDLKHAQCKKCGQKGHLARNCTNPRRYCPECKEPILGIQGHDSVTCCTTSPTGRLCKENILHAWSKGTCTICGCEYHSCMDCPTLVYGQSPEQTKKVPNAHLHLLRYCGVPIENDGFTRPLGQRSIPVYVTQNARRIATGSQELDHLPPPPPTDATVLRPKISSLDKTSTEENLLDHSSTTTHEWAPGGIAEQQRIDRKVTEGTAQVIMAAKTQVHSLQKIVESEISRVDNLCSSLSDRLMVLSTSVEENHTTSMANHAAVMAEVSTVKDVGSRLNAMQGMLEQLVAQRTTPPVHGFQQPQCYSGAPPQFAQSSQPSSSQLGSQHASQEFQQHSSQSDGSQFTQNLRYAPLPGAAMHPAHFYQMQVNRGSQYVHNYTQRPPQHNSSGENAPSSHE